MKTPSRCARALCGEPPTIFSGRSNVTTLCLAAPRDRFDSSTNQFRGGIQLGGGDAELAFFPKNPTFSRKNKNLWGGLTWVDRNFVADFAMHFWGRKSRGVCGNPLVTHDICQSKEAHQLQMKLMKTRGFLAFYILSLDNGGKHMGEIDQPLQLYWQL